MLFIVSVTRANGLASATIKQVRSSIRVPQLAIGQMNIDIDIEARLSNGTMLDLNEVESVVRFRRREVASIVQPVASLAAVASKVVNLEKVRIHSPIMLEASHVESHMASVQVR